MNRHAAGADPAPRSRHRREGTFFARLRRADGVAMVEFALVLPVLLLLVTGILEFGLMFNKYISMTDAARIGARAVALSRGSIGDACASAQTNLESNEPTLNLTSANFTPIPAFSNAADSCADPTSWTQGDAVTFYIQKPFTFNLLFSFPTFTVTLKAQATDSIE